MHPSVGDHRHHPQHMCAEFQTCAQLELVQMVLIVVVMLVMVVVVTCVLNRYRMAARSPHFGPRPSASPSPPPCSDHHLEAGAGIPGHAFRSGFRSGFPFPRRHPTVDLPPSISLSDGEEPPPYLGPCALQLRDPEQQMELNRESLRPPPNRTVFDSLDPPSSYAGVQANRQKLREEAPPTYKEAIGHWFQQHGAPPLDGQKAKEKSQDPRAG
ncbi:protein TMEPAI-like isoform X2 [Stigmatopora nigra]